MRRTIGTLILVIIGLFAVILLGLATPAGRGLVASYAERIASSNGLTVSIETPTGWPPFWFGADKITIADAAGPFAEIEDVTVDVGFSGLLVGRVGLDSIDVGRLAVARRPDLPQSDGSGALFPFAAERFTISRLELGAALVGRSATLTATGSFSSRSDGGIDLDLNAERIDGQEGTFNVALGRANAMVPYAADIRVSEAVNGILVGLMGRPSGPAFNLTAQAIPDGDTVRGSVTLASSDAAQFNGGFVLTPDGASKRLEVTARGDLASLVPPEYAGLLSGPLDLGFDADWLMSAQGIFPQVTIRQGRLSTASINATASGTLSPDVADLALTVDIVDPAGTAIDLPMLAQPSEVQRVSLRGTVAPSNGIIRLDLVGNVTGLQVGGIAVPGTGLSLAIESAGENPFLGGEFPFALRLEADAVRMTSGEITASPDAPLLLTSEGKINTATGLAEANAVLRAAGGQASFKGVVSADGGSGNARVAFSDVSPLSNLVGRDMSGGFDVSTDGSYFGADGVDLLVSAEMTDFDPGIETAGRLLNGQTNLTAKLARGSGDVWSVSALDLEGTVLAVTGNVTLGADDIEAVLEGAIADLSVLADNTDGAATFTANISGKMPSPTLDAELRISDGRLLNHPIRDGLVSVRGQASDNGWTGSAKLGGSFAGKPLAGTVDVVAIDGGDRLAFPGIDLTIDDNRISGALDRTNDGLLSGSLDVAAPNLNTLAALALVEAAGSGRARLIFTPDGDRQTVAVSFSGDDISYQTLSSNAVSGQATIGDAFGTPLINGEVALNETDIGSVRLENISASASVDGDATAFNASAKGADIDLAGSGAFSRDSAASILRLDEIAGSAFRIPVELQEPVSIRLGDEQGGGLPTTRIAVGSGSVVVEGSVSPALDLTIVADSVPASVANGFAPNLGADGTVSGRATVTGATAAPRIAWQADWAGMQTAATRNARLPPLQLSASGTATRRDTTIDGNVTGVGLALSIQGRAPFAGDGLAIGVTGDAPLALLALETTREVGLAGTARLDINVTGSTRSPQVSGTINLADATFVDRETGFGVNGANGRIVFDGQRATIERISGRISQGGQIDIAGSVDIGTAQMPGNLTINVADGRYNDGQVVNALFNANLAVNGPLLGDATISGTVALGRTEIQLPDRLSIGANAIDVKHINAPPGFVPPLSAELQQGGRSSSTSGLRLDIELTNSGGIFVRGFGVDSEFGGSLRVANTIADPQAVGAFTLRRGRIEVVGRRFELQSGTLTFDGDLVPVVDFTASTSASDAVVSVNVIGPADDPVITFTSNPDLPEEEIFSRLLFNRNVSSLSVVQAAQLIDAAAQFTGVGGGQSFFARIRDSLGVDDLDVRQNASGGTTVGIAKRINENVRLGVEAGSSSDDSRVTIDLDLTPNLSVRGEAGGGDTGSLGLTYEREY